MASFFWKKRVTMIIFYAVIFCYIEAVKHSDKTLKAYNE